MNKNIEKIAELRAIDTLDQMSIEKVKEADVIAATLTVAAKLKIGRAHV